MPITGPRAVPTPRAPRPRRRTVAVVTLASLAMGAAACAPTRDAASTQGARSGCPAALVVEGMTPLSLTCLTATERRPQPPDELFADARGIVARAVTPNADNHVGALVLPRLWLMALAPSGVPLWGVESSDGPVVVDERTVRVFRNGDRQNPTPELLVFDRATGARVGASTPALPGGVSCAARDAAGSLFVATSYVPDATARKPILAKLSPDGVVVWKVDLPGTTTSHVFAPAIAVDAEGTSLYIGDSVRLVVDARGAIVASSEHAQAMVAAAALTQGGFLVATSRSTQRVHLESIDPSGRVLATSDVAVPIATSAIAVSANGDVAVMGGAASSDATLSVARIRHGIATTVALRGIAPTDIAFFGRVTHDERGGFLLMAPVKESAYRPGATPFYLVARFPP